MNANNSSEIETEFTERLVIEVLPSGLPSIDTISSISTQCQSLLNGLQLEL